MNAVTTNLYWKGPAMRCVLPILVGQMLLCAFGERTHAETPPLKIATFTVDASPPVGSLIAYDITERIESPLS